MINNPFGAFDYMKAVMIKQSHCSPQFQYIALWLGDVTSSAQPALLIPRSKNASVLLMTPSKSHALKDSGKQIAHSSLYCQTLLRVTHPKPSTSSYFFKVLLQSGNRSDKYIKKFEYHIFNFAFQI